jgi:hypothetical protein
MGNSTDSQELGVEIETKRGKLPSGSPEEPSVNRVRPLRVALMQTANSLLPDSLSIANQDIAQDQLLAISTRLKHSREQLLTVDI